MVNFIAVTTLTDVRFTLLLAKNI